MQVCERLPRRVGGERECREEYPAEEGGQQQELPDGRRAHPESALEPAALHFLLIALPQHYPDQDEDQLEQTVLLRQDVLSPFSILEPTPPTNTS